MKKERLFSKLVLMMLFMLPLGTLAQSVKGKVVDTKGNAIPFATVVEKGTSNGTTTDDEGKFNLKVLKLPATLIFSSVGYTTVTVTSSGVFSIILKEENVGLNEIVIQVTKLFLMQQRILIREN